MANGVTVPKAATYDDPFEHLLTLTIPASSQVAKRFREFVTYDDCHQEAVVYVLERQQKLQEELMQAYENGAEETRHMARKIMSRMRRHVEKYARREKAVRSGYRQNDEYFYDKIQIASLMPAVIMFNETAEIVVEHVDDGQPKPKRSPSEGGNLLAMIVDVKRIFDKLEPEAQMLLEQYYGEGLTLKQLGEAWDANASTIDRRIHALLKRIIDGLGGVSPY